MRRISKPSTTEIPTDPQQSLVPPAVRGLTWGFLIGILAVIALTLAAPSACTRETARGTETLSTSAQ